MKKAWQDPIGFIRDVCPGDPDKSYHPDIAKLYTTDVPDDTENGAVLENGAWVKPPPPPPPPPPPEPAAVIPQAVGMAEARKALILGGVTPDMVYAAIDAMPDPVQKALALVDWDYQVRVRRDSPLVANLAPALGLTAEQVDELFIAAKALEAQP